MLDLANVTEPGRATFTTYLRSWERFAGRPADPRLTRIGCLSATDYINTFYMAFAVKPGLHRHRGARQEFRRRLGSELVVAVRVEDRSR